MTRRAHTVFIASAAAAALCLALASCGPSATEGGFDSANPAAKMYAIEQAAREGDRSAVSRIVEQLDSDDPAVRLLAIATLQRLTGQTYGYRHYDPPHVRKAAIEQWVAAVESGELDVIDPTSSSQSPITLKDGDG